MTAAGGVGALTLPDSDSINDGWILVNQGGGDVVVNRGDNEIATLSTETAALLRISDAGVDCLKLGAGSGPYSGDSSAGDGSGDSSGGGGSTGDGGNDGSTGGDGGGGTVPQTTTVTVSLAGANPAAAQPEGIFWQRGTNFGTTAYSNPLDGTIFDIAEVTANNSNDITSLRQIADRQANYQFSYYEGGFHFVIDFDVSNEGNGVNLDGLLWQHGYENSTYRTQQIVVYAGEGDSLSTVVWTEITRVNDANFLPAVAYSWSNLLALQKRPTPYRYLKIQATGLDTNGYWYLSCGELEFSGDIVTVNQGT